MSSFKYSKDGSMITNATNYSTSESSPSRGTDLIANGNEVARNLMRILKDLTLAESHSMMENLGRNVRYVYGKEQSG